MAVPIAPHSITGNGWDSKVSLRWNPPSTDASSITAYNVEYGTNGVAWTTGPTVSDLFVDITGLTNGTLYYFRVSATNPDGTGPFTTATTITPRAQEVSLTAPGAHPLLASRTKSRYAFRTPGSETQGTMINMVASDGLKTINDKIGFSLTIRPA